MLHFFPKVLIYQISLLSSFILLVNKSGMLSNSRVQEISQLLQPCKYFIWSMYTLEHPTDHILVYIWMYRGCMALSSILIRIDQTIMSFMLNLILGSVHSVAVLFQPLPCNFADLVWDQIDSWPSIQAQKAPELFTSKRLLYFKYMLTYSICLLILIFL